MDRDWDFWKEYEQGNKPGGFPACWRCKHYDLTRKVEGKAIFFCSKHQTNKPITDWCKDFVFESESAERRELAWKDQERLFDRLFEKFEK